MEADEEPASIRIFAAAYPSSGQSSQAVPIPRNFSRSHGTQVAAWASWSSAIRRQARRPGTPWAAGAPSPREPAGDRTWPGRGERRRLRARAPPRPGTRRSAN